MTLLLLFLNVASNYILYQARTTQQQETLTHLRTAALAISRDVQQAYPSPISEARLDSIRQQAELSGLVIVPSRPSDESVEARRKWLSDVIGKLPKDHLPMVAEALFTSGFHQLTRGSGPQFYYLYPIPSGAGHNLLILTAERPNLAYLDDSRETLFVVQVASLAFVALLYVMLSRFIFRPFRRIRSSAARAGRHLDDEDQDETEAIVREYEDVIEELRESEAELLRLNEAIQNRADSIEQFNYLLMESGQSGILSVGPDGTIVGANERARELLRIEGEKSGQPAKEVLGHVLALGQSVAEAVESGRMAAYREYGDLFADGTDLVLGVSMNAIGDTSSGACGVLVFINDVTETARLRRELEGKKRLVALGEMAGGLAHQIRNSLGAISGYANLCRKQLRKAGQSQERADTLLAETKEAETLIGRFLTFARPFDYTPSPTRLDMLVRDTVEQFEIREDCGNITFDICAPRAITVQADQVLLKQVLGNLIDNAVQAYDCRPGIVRVELESGQTAAAVKISDEAGGIPTDELDSIFTPFFSTRPSGTGLGLPLASRIVDLHRGRLTVESQLGEGSCFAVTLPVEQADPSDTPVSEQPDHA